MNIACSPTQILVIDEQNQVITHDTGCFDLHKLTNDDRALAQEILWEALDEVGLYTILDTLKAVSDVRSFYRKAVDDIGNNNSENQQDSTNNLLQIQRVIDALNCGHIHFTLTPFSSIHNDERYFQIRVVNSTVLNRVIDKYPDFWQNWGFVSGSNSATILTVIEYESRFNRFRGYGYLYGYPPHAVDFFVEAARIQKETDQFVTRDFVQIPTFIRETGAFVYAVPKDHTLNESDIILRDKALITLSHYREFRQNNTFNYPENLIRFWLTHTD